MRNGCRFEPLGARVAANSIARNASAGTGSSRYRRIDRVLTIPSISPTVSVGNGVTASMPATITVHAVSDTT